MEYKWLSQENNNKLIIFFNGWGMDEFPVKHLASDDYDIIMFYKYHSLHNDFNFDSINNNYIEINLIAWSMGVMVAHLIPEIVNLFSKNNKKGIAVAINGTLNPIDELFGIHPKIYNLTIKNFNDKNRKNFINSMFSNETADRLESLNIKREIEEQKAELIAIKDYKTKKSFDYDKILISQNDKIIPTKSQINFWGIEPNLVGGHCPFFDFLNWSDLL